MKRFSLLALVLLFITVLAFPGCTRSKGEVDGPIKFVFLHTNDFHGQMLPQKRKVNGQVRQTQGAAYLSTAIHNIRKDAQRRGAHCFLLSAGDLYQGTPEGNFTKGRLVIEHMNYLDYDAAAIGNHEYDYGEKNVAQLEKLSTFPFLGGNIMEKKTGRCPDYAKPYVFFERQGIKVAFIGMTTSNMRWVTLPSAVKRLDFEKEVKAAERLVKKVRKLGADVVVLVTHCGVEVDKQVAKGVEGIDFIIGGHSHTKLKKPVVIGQTWIGQAGSRGAFLGQIEFMVHPEKKTLSDRKYRLYPIDDRLSSDPKSIEILNRYKPAIDKVMNKKVGEMKQNMPHWAGIQSSPMGNFFADALRAAGKADIALQNKFGIRSDLKKGIILERQIYQAAPFDNAVTVMELTGRQIHDLLLNGLRANYVLCLSGAICHYDVKDGKRVITKVILDGGRKLDFKKNYTVATNSFLAGGGDKFYTFKKGKNKRQVGVSYRQALRQHVRKNSPVEYKHTNRYVPVSGVVPKRPKRD